MYFYTNILGNSRRPNVLCDQSEAPSESVINMKLSHLSSGTQHNYHITHTPTHVNIFPIRNLNALRLYILTT